MFSQQLHEHASFGGQRLVKQVPHAPQRSLKRQQALVRADFDHGRTLVALEKAVQTINRVISSAKRNSPKEQSHQPGKERWIRIESVVQGHADVGTTVVDAASSAACVAQPSGNHHTNATVHHNQDQSGSAAAALDISGHQVDGNIAVASRSSYGTLPEDHGATAAFTAAESPASLLEERQEQRVSTLLHPRPLSSYLLLPVDDYVLLDPSMVTREGANTFRIAVPLREVTGVALSPVVRLSVHPEPNAQRVRFVLEDIRVGDPAIDQRFKSKLTATLSATRAKGLLARLMGGTASSSEQALASDVSSDSYDSSDSAGVESVSPSVDDVLQAAQGSYISEQRLQCKVTVEMEVLASSSLAVVPAPLLGAAGGLVFKALLQGFMPLALKQLVKDYASWALGLPRKSSQAGSLLPGAKTAAIQETLKT